MQAEMNRMFQNSFHYRGTPGSGMFSNDMSFGYDFDIKETDEGYKIVFDMTGLDEQNVDIQVNEHSITVKGEHRREDAEEAGSSLFRSQSYGSFLKTIPVPADADTSKVMTEKEGDELVIKLPKKRG
jgi:HSP20 family protein